MIPLGECEITGLFGPMASGKTFLLNQWLQNQNRYIRFDATGESCDDPGIEHIWANPKALWARLKENPYYFRLAYHPGSDIQFDFELALQCISRIDCPKLLVCDEFHEVCSVNETPRFVQTAMRYARHALLGIVGASQRLADVHKLFTAGCRRVILFHSSEARDIVAIRDRWGSDCAELVQNLRPLKFDDASKTTLQIPQCVVVARGEKPQVYDFQTNTFTMGMRSGSEVPEGSLQRETDSSESPERAEGDSESGDRGDSRGERDAMDAL